MSLSYKSHKWGQKSLFHSKMRRGAELTEWLWQWKNNNKDICLLFYSGHSNWLSDYDTGKKKTFICSSTMATHIDWVIMTLYDTGKTITKTFICSSTMAIQIDWLWHRNNNNKDIYLLIYDGHSPCPQFCSVSAVHEDRQSHLSAEPASHSSLPGVRSSCSADPHSFAWLFEAHPVTEKKHSGTEAALKRWSRCRIKDRSDATFNLCSLLSWCKIRLSSSFLFDYETYKKLTQTHTCVYKPASLT